MRASAGGTGKTEGTGLRPCHAHATSARAHLPQRAHHHPSYTTQPLRGELPTSSLQSGARKRKLGKGLIPRTGRGRAAMAGNERFGIGPLLSNAAVIQPLGSLLPRGEQHALRVKPRNSKESRSHLSKPTSFRRASPALAFSLARCVCTDVGLASLRCSDGRR